MNRKQFLSIVIVTTLVILLIAIPSPKANANAQASSSKSDAVTLQKTAVSSLNPLPGHSAHQAVMVLPPRSDGKVWIGTVTWTASKPVEVVVLHMYNSSVIVDPIHRQPLTSPFGNGSRVAITLVQSPEDFRPVDAGGMPVGSGSMPFAGNALGFHTLNGEDFTVTYTLDAVAKKLTQ